MVGWSIQLAGPDPLGTHTRRNEEVAHVSEILRELGLYLKHSLKISLKGKKWRMSRRCVCDWGGCSWARA
eukprot:3638731-Alexandrium_andersonii.AAC.1